jgi:predicted MFS family arabinose efflux permease
MDKALFFLVTFGVPILLYGLWLGRFAKRLRFPGLLILMMLSVWLLTFPFYYFSDLTGLALLSWLDAVVGLISVVLAESFRRTETRAGS